MLRAKVFCIIVSIVAAMAISSAAAGLLFTEKRMLDTIEGDMTVVREIADRLISSELNLMKANLRAIAARLKHKPNDTITKALETQRGIGEGYLSLALFDKEEGLIAACGTEIPAAEFAGGSYARSAFDGSSVVSTTEPASGGNLVFRICVPAGTRVLVGTVPGNHFSRLVAPFRIWKSGAIFVVDGEGNIIAHRDDKMVTDRSNVISLSSLDPGSFEEAAEIHERMTKGEKGVGAYEFFGVRRVCAFGPVSMSRGGWSIGVVAPIAETPAAYTRRGLFIAAGLFVFLGIVAAFAAANVIAAPIEKIDEQNARLEELKDTAERASNAKSDFLANMSHEMRTPLSAVIGLSELALDGADPDTLTESLKKINAAGVTLLGIVNDILDISKIEAGRFELTPEAYDAASLINDTAGLNIIRAGDKPVKFRLNVDPTIPARLAGDELRVRQIFNNLLSNAFKYTERGFVDWSVSWERDGGDLWLVSRVADTGIGIREEDIGRLFSDYNQLDTTRKKKIEGTGLGLSITKRLVDMMDGVIAVKSEFGKGSAFTVRIRQGFVSDAPLGDAVAEKLMNFRYADCKRERNEKLARVFLPGARVLVVDDVSTNLDIARGMMKPYGMKIDCASGGREAVELVRAAETRYDAIFMDHMMPDMDGIEATRIIRGEIGTEYARNVPIIALTANAISGSEKKFLDMGFQAFIPKPIDILLLDKVIRQWVKGGAQKDGRTAETSVPEAGAANRNAGVPGEIPGVDVNSALSRFGGDTRVLTEVLRAYAANTPPLCERARALSQGDLREYAVVVHGIKGSSRGICADGVGKLAEALERAAKAGRRDFVRAETESFIAETERLVEAINAALARSSAPPKPRKTRPDAKLLGLLRNACAAFSMDAADEVMSELERYEYENQSDFISWLRERMEVADFDGMLGKLAEY
jgi:signal transduction histidine kinase/DNA-binding NarL/FixJ family response regulator